MRIKRALISVSNKAGLLPLVKGLSSLGIEILSTGGTAKLLKQENIPVVEVSDYTGQPEILDGRLKTLHPKIHGGLLAMRSNPKHLEEMKGSDIGPIDLLIVNLYPFEETISKSNVHLEEAIENIDIGGPTMIRAAAKNWQDVAVLIDPTDYEKVLNEIKEKGEVSKETKFDLAVKVFIHTARYDGAIANYLSGGKDKTWPQAFNYQGLKLQDLRYGENPHQKAVFYRDQLMNEPVVANAEQLHGKELSYNNIMDLDAAIEIVKEFQNPVCVVIKHNNPCGAASSKSASAKDLFVSARECDPQSAFGGIIGLNVRIDAATAQEIAKDFYECVIAPSYDEEALAILQAKKAIRLMVLKGLEVEKRFTAPMMEFKKVGGGLLVQEKDRSQEDLSQAKVVTGKEPTSAQRETLSFAWKICKNVKSNAIVYAVEEKGIYRSVGIGCGQVSRVDASRFGALKSRVSLQGAVMASDAFFPFRDNIDEAAKVGIAAIVQPGGSIRDTECIEAANEKGITMIFTGVRHFKH